MKKLLLVGLIAVSSLAFGQATTIIPTFTVQGASFALVYNTGQLSGTLSSVSINATLSAQTGNTWANDLSILVLPDNTINGTPLLQVGGDTDFGADEFDGWPNGGASAVGTVVNGSYTLTTPLNFTTNPAYTVRLGNGYANGTNSGTWTSITLTLTGVTAAALGTTEISAKSDVGVSIYPNPVVDVINVKTKDSKINLVSVNDMSGKAIKTILTSDKKNELSINVSELTSGNYMLIIDTEKGRFSKKFIKK